MMTVRKWICFVLPLSALLRSSCKIYGRSETALWGGPLRVRFVTQIPQVDFFFNIWFALMKKLSPNPCWVSNHHHHHLPSPPNHGFAVEFWGERRTELLALKHIYIPMELPSTRGEKMKSCVNYLFMTDYQHARYHVPPLTPQHAQHEMEPLCTTDISFPPPSFPTSLLSASISLSPSLPHPNQASRMHKLRPQIRIRGLDERMPLRQEHDRCVHNNNQLYPSHPASSSAFSMVENPLGWGGRAREEEGKGGKGKGERTPHDITARETEDQGTAPDPIIY